MSISFRFFDKLDKVLLQNATKRRDDASRGEVEH